MFDDKNSAELFVDALLGDLYKASLATSDGSGCDYSEEAISKLERLKNPIPVWRIDSTSVDAYQVDRKSNMFGGNPFTSLKHPWLMNDSGNPFYPLVQVNLGEISHICNKNFGCGLLQVWLDVNDPDLCSVIRIIDLKDMDDGFQVDYPDLDKLHNVDEYGQWFSISKNFSFELLGYMLPRWANYDLEVTSDRDLSDLELEISSRLEELSEEHGYRSINTNWLLGYPDRGSGSPAGRYDPEPLNLIQFSTADIFPMVGISRYGNLFYSNDEGEIGYFFDWNG